MLRTYLTKEEIETIKEMEKRCIENLNNAGKEWVVKFTHFLLKDADEIAQGLKDNPSAINAMSDLALVGIGHLLMKILDQKITESN